MSKPFTQVERITALEVQVESLTKKVDSMDSKLDDLIGLRNKGAGAFLLASALFGTTLVGLVTLVISWFK